MYHVITIGSATLDVFLRSTHLHANTHLSTETGESKELCLPFGGKTEVEEAQFDSGGGGTNSAVTFARQGLNVAVIAKIGKDFAGEKVMQELAKEKVDTSLMIQDPNDSTDFATIIWAPNFGTSILVYRGKGRIDTTNIPFDTIQTQWAYISSTEGNLDLITSYKLRVTSLKIAWNPGKKELEQKDKLIAALQHVELFMLNREEATELLDMPPTDDIKPLLVQAQTLSCKSVIITDGHRGSYYFSHDLRFGGQGKWLHAGIFAVERLETTGAGDAFGSTFVAGKIKGLPDDQCLKMAAANSASVVTQTGAKKGILKEEEMNEWLKKDIPINPI